MSNSGTPNGGNSKKNNGNGVARANLPRFGRARWVELNPQFKACALKMWGESADRKPCKKLYFIPLWILHKVTDAVGGASDYRGKFFYVGWIDSETICVSFTRDGTVFYLSQDDLAAIFQIEEAFESLRDLYPQREEDVEFEHGAEEPEEPDAAIDTSDEVIA